MRTLPILLIAFVLYFLASCGIKTQTSGKSQKYFQSYYVGQEGTTYFIKPLWFQAKPKGNHLSCDFTFRYKNSDTVAYRMNVSVISSAAPLKQIDSIKLEAGGQQLVFKAGELMFNETVKNGYLSRFGFEEAPLSKLSKLFLTPNWQWTVYKQDGSEQFFTNSGKTKKSISEINKRLMILIN